ncbi:MAG: hypothetical protein IRY95_03170 [Clostridia bacterium]|nr:hypothetical protein [Clostridia bacterium]
MLVDTRLIFVTRCPDCGRFLQESASLFEMVVSGDGRGRCGCGARVYSLAWSPDRRAVVQVTCHLCGDVHRYPFRGPELWHGGLHELGCSVGDFTVGLVGREGTVERRAEELRLEWEDGLADTGEDYFLNPDVMYEVLGFVYDLADEGRLVCACGNRRLEMDVLPDVVELHCPKCGRDQVIPATAYEDVRRLKELGAAAPSGPRQRRGMPGRVRPDR